MLKYDKLLKKKCDFLFLDWSLVISFVPSSKPSDIVVWLAIGNSIAKQDPLPNPSDVAVILPPCKSTIPLQTNGKNAKLNEVIAMTIKMLTK